MDELDVPAGPMTTIQVVAGVLQTRDGLVLVGERPAGKRMSGAWEFPGGKLHKGEGRLEGLARELHEELGIRVEQARPLIRYRHWNADFEHEVDLDVWCVERWTGEPHGREGQRLAWLPAERLLESGLLPADAAAARAIQLPSVCVVTPPAAEGGEKNFLDHIEHIGSVLEASLLCLRRPDLDRASLIELMAGVACRLEGTGTRVILHGAAGLASVLSPSPANANSRVHEAVAGLHISARSLETLKARPVPVPLLFGVSCHDARQLERSLALDADYAFLGPVKETASHPGSPAMGWEAFADLVADLPIPVYAIGGLGAADLDAAWAAGAQGIAAIRGLWPQR
jgi:8-oxo-dGTP diphosphatase